MKSSPRGPTGAIRGGGLRLEWPDFWQPFPDRQGDDGDQLERPSLLRASAGKSRRFGSRKGPPKGRGERLRDNSAWRVARKPAPMKNLTTKRALRCAIYTRVSTDQGLEQDFNSLDAQREASEAYIKSQAHEGWRLVRDRRLCRNCSSMCRPDGSTSSSSSLGRRPSPRMYPQRPHRWPCLMRISSRR